MPFSKPNPLFILPFAWSALLVIGCRIEAPPSGGPDKGEDKKPEGPATPITAEQLGKEFKADKEAATSKYKDKLFLIEGVVNDGNNVVGPKVVNPYVVLEGFTPPNAKGLDVVHLMCMMSPEGTKKAANLSKGQKVKIRGKCADTFVHLVRFIECDLVEAGPDTAVAVTSEQLAKDYAEDKDAAEKRYKEKQLIVEGPVTDLFESKSADLARTYYKMHLKGFEPKEGKPIRVEVYLEKDDFGKLKKGQKVKFKTQDGASYFEFDNEVNLSCLRLLE